jgi:hypothetical protein
MVYLQVAAVNTALPEEDCALDTLILLIDVSIHDVVVLSLRMREQ